MPNIRATEMMFLDDLFEMGGGYVLKFSDPTFSRFFRDELSIDIDAQRYRANGSSKAKRLRTFLQIEDRATVARALEALWEYREALRKRARQAETLPEASSQLRELVQRLAGTQSTQSTNGASKLDAEISQSLLADLIALSMLDPQPRGYAFEKFLKSFFDKSGLEAREAFRLRGEQIDGSFQLVTDTYLLEAKWQNLPCGAEDLHAFHGKLDQKAAWTRGLFISNSGFSEDGLSAFGKAKRLVCMDGLDLYEVLQRKLILADVLAKKVRRAAETGAAFARVRDLFPS